MRTSSVTLGRSTVQLAGGVGGSVYTPSRISDLSRYQQFPASEPNILTSFQFAPYRVEHIGGVDRVRVTCSATEQLPTPDNPNYQYEPKPPDEIPPVPTRLLMEYFENPSCAGTSTGILEAFPVRTTGKMSRQEKHGWGLHAEEHLSFCRIGIVAIVILVGPTWFFVHWLCLHPGDLQNASVPMFLALAFIGTFAMMFDRGK